jgi:hypothetical protein
LNFDYREIAIGASASGMSRKKFSHQSASRTPPLIE